MPQDKMAHPILKRGKKANPLTALCDYCPLLDSEVGKMVLYVTGRSCFNMKYALWVFAEKRSSLAPRKSQSTALVGRTVNANAATASDIILSKRKKNTS